VFWPDTSNDGAGDAMTITAGMIVDGIAASLLILGSLVILLAAVGAVRFPDITSRLHAAAKAPVLGILFIGAGVVVALGTAEATIVVGLVVLLQLIASPVGSHMLARSVYHRLDPEIDGTDELAEADIDDAEIDDASSG
jgi:multicomponent Na+:H+ antiporter subunit G